MAGAVERVSTRRRSLLAGAVTTLVLAVAVIAGLTSPTTGGTPVLFVDRISSAISNTASRAGEVWWAYAFGTRGGGCFQPVRVRLAPGVPGPVSA
jgi:hypothetical protein